MVRPRLSHRRQRPHPRKKTCISQDFGPPRALLPCSTSIPKSDRLLCLDVRDEFASKWFLYDLAKKRRKSLGNASTFGLFLDRKLLDTLQSAKRREGGR